MALSVFSHEEECIPPSNLINLVYNASSYNGLNATPTSNAVNPYYINGTPSVGDQLTVPTTCSSGFDIAFLVDYTGSMGNSIDGVKAGISNIINTIDAESNGNFRVSLTLFDEVSGSNASGPSSYNNAIYQNLPSTQKVKIANGTNDTQFITCMCPFFGVGQTSDFLLQLNVLNTSNFPLGSGGGIPEPGGLAVNEIVSNGIAGGFRAEAIKIIILITDAVPGGDDDVNNTVDQTYFNNTLIGIVDSLDVQVMVQSTKAASSTGNYYNNLATGTTPVGRYDQVVFDNAGTWVNTGLISGIESLCGESNIPTCDDAPAGWYHEYGTTFAFYYNGSTVTNIYYYPPEYTLESPTSSASEGGSFTFDALTRYVTLGTTLYWTVDTGSSTNMSNDFTNAANQGQVTIQENTGISTPQSGKRRFGFTVRQDNLTEGQERFKLHLRTGSYTGTIVASTDWLYINDTSLTPTATPVPPTATPIPAGNCQHSWFANGVDSNRYGLRYKSIENGQYVTKRLNQMISTCCVWRYGKEGYVVSVCSQEVVNVYDFNNNALVSGIDGFERLASGGSCTSDVCSYDAPSPTATPVPTATPYPTATPTPTPYPTHVPTLTPTPYPTATPVPTPVPTMKDSGGGSGPTSTPLPTPVPPTATPSYYVYELSSCNSEQSNVRARSNTERLSNLKYDLTGSSYASGSPWTILRTRTGFYDTWIASVTRETCDSGGECLLEGTQIKLSSGTSAQIETLKVGDTLASNNIGNMPNTDNVLELLTWEETDPLVSSTTTTIVGIELNTVNRVLRFNQGLLTSTVSHLHVIKRDNLWMITQAINIKEGDIFINDSGAEHIINSIEDMSGTFNTYKIDVEENDTYIANNIITHNRKLEDPV